MWKIEYVKYFWSTVYIGTIQHSYISNKCSIIYWRCSFNLSELCVNIGTIVWLANYGPDSLSGLFSIRHFVHASSETHKTWMTETNQRLLYYCECLFSDVESSKTGTCTPWAMALYMKCSQCYFMPKYNTVNRKVSCVEFFAC